MRRLLALVALLLLATPCVAAILLGPLSSGSNQGGGGGIAPVVTPLTCNAILPVTTSHVNLKFAA